MSDLQARLLAAREIGDHKALVALYREAAQRAPNPDAAGFFLTHAYIFALETGHDAAPALRDQLVAMGRESA